MDTEQTLTEYASQYIEDKIIYKNYCKVGLNLSSLTILTYDGLYNLHKFYLTGNEFSHVSIMLQPEDLEGIFTAIRQ